MRLLTTLITLFLAGVASFVSARDLMHTERYTMNDGLPSNRISSICEDAEGKIWFATWNGLCCWDGKNLKAFSATSDGNKFGRLKSVKSLQEGFLFIQNDASDSLCYNPRTGLLRPMPDSVNVVRFNTNAIISDILEDEDGLNIIREGIAYHIPYDEGLRQEKQLSVFYEDRNGEIWMNFKNCLYHVWFETSPFFYHTSWPRGDRIPFKSTVRSLMSTSDGKILAASRNYRLYGLMDSVLQVPYPGNVYDMKEDDLHRIWLALRRKGLFVWSEKRGIQPAMEDLSEAGMTDVFSLLKLDNQPMLWVGTWGNGIRIIDISGDVARQKYTLCNDSLKSIHSFSQLKNGLVCACSSSGLHLFSPTGVPIYVVAPQWDVLSVIELPNKRILFSTMGHGLFWMSPNGTFVEDFEMNIEDRITTMYLTSDNILWLVSDTRLYRYQISNGKVDKLDEKDFGEELTFSEGTVALHRDSLLCIGASSGIFEINLNQIDSYLDARQNREERAYMEQVLLYTFIMLGLLAMVALVVWLIWRSAVLQVKTNREMMPIEPTSSIENPIPAPKEKEDVEDVFVTKLNQVMEEAIGNPDVDITMLARMMGMPKNAFYYRCNEVFHTSPAALLQDIRIDRAHELLKNSETPVREVAFLVGFRDPKYFSKVFKSKIGVSPSQIKKE